MKRKKRRKKMAKEFGERGVRLLHLWRYDYDNYEWAGT
jgi:hypothetical protein